MIAASLSFRPATLTDLPALVRLLADDELGNTREHPADPLPTAYEEAFRAIDRDPNNALVAVENEVGAIVATLQLTFIPGLTFQGGTRLQIEAVRVARDCRGLGIGEAVFSWAISQARTRGCRLVQLTTNKTRSDALRFYERLGFTASHEGLKLMLQAVDETTA